jgi:signal transduction histidine kinase/DNA-binding NarL/FixJ family response regulator/HPt (histidine-containing phosphotransfer) domain-containing protein
MLRLPITRNKLLIYTLLMAVTGLLLNKLAPIPLYYKLSLLLGSIPALISLELFGKRSAIFTGITAAAGTLLLWNQPYPFLVLTAEILFIVLLSGIIRNRMLCGAVFWSGLGVPTIWLVFHFILGSDSGSASVYAFKFGVNGLFNIMLASLILMAIRFIRFRRYDDPELRIPLIDAMSMLLISVVFLPALLMIAMHVRSEQADHEARSLQLSQKVLSGAQELIGEWLEERTSTLKTLAHTATDHNLTPSASLQTIAERLIEADNSVMQLELVNRQGILLQTSTNCAAPKTGKNCLATHKNLLKTLSHKRLTVSGLLEEPCCASEDPSFEITVPITFGKKIIGAATALISLKRLKERMEYLSSRQGVTISVLDSSNRLLTSTAAHGFSKKQGAYLDIPAKTSGTPWIDLMRRADLINRVPLANGTDWDLVVEVPYRPGVDMLNHKAKQTFGALFALMVAVTITARYVSGRFTRGMRLLQQQTASLPVLINNDQYPDKWPRTMLKEIGELTADVQEMAANLSTAFTQMKAVNENLEERVEERTMELNLATLQLKHDEAELIEAKNSAEMANLAKSRFLAIMSHEIRTPMNAILGITSLLQKTSLDSRQQELLQYSSESADSLLRIIDDILDFSKIEAHKLEISKSPFRLYPLLESIQKLFAVVAEKKHLALALSVGQDVPNLLAGDQGRLRQVITNLVGNAIKFTPQGEVDIEVRLVETDPTANSVILGFKVKDTGIGVEKDQQDNIFDMFSQADSSTTREFGGTGLGLSICRKLVELMGGEIRVSSAPGKGSCFSFELPFELPAADSLPPEADSTDAATASLVKLKVLLAEDNKINLLVARELLKGLGQEVFAVKNGQLLLEALAKDRYDLVLTDISMPVMDGIQAAVTIRSGKIAGVDPNIPIIAMTAHVMPEERLSYQTAGMNGYVAKPVDLDQLKNEICRVIPGACISAPAMAQPSTPSQTCEPQDDPMDREYQKKNYFDIGCADVLADVSRIYAESAPAKLVMIRQMIQAGGADLAPLVSVAHGLKGESGSVGAKFVTAQAAAIEKAARKGDIVEARRLLPDLEKELARALKVIETEFMA